MTTTPDRIWVTPGPEKCNWIGDAYSAPDPDYDAPQIEYVRGEWQPIATAPKDRDILVYRPTMWRGKGHIGKARWQPDEYAKKPRPFWESSEGWIGKTEDREHEPTHWLPIPAAPEESA